MNLGKIALSDSSIFLLNLLDDSILHVDICQEWLIIIHNLCSFDKETITLKE